MELNSKWKEMLTNNFILGKEIPDNIKTIEENHKVIADALLALGTVRNNLALFSDKLAKIDLEYRTAKENLDIEILENLTNEAKMVNKIIIKNFDFTLNGLSAKKEGENEEKMKERIEEELSLPLIK